MSNTRPIRPTGPHSGAAMDSAVQRPFWRRALPATLAGSALIVAAAVWSMGFSEAGRSFSVGVDRLKLATVERGVFDDFIPIRGRVVPRRTVFLDAVEGGRVEAVLVEDGARVTAGTPLVRLTNTQLQLDVIAREAEVTQQINNVNTLRLQLEQNRLAHRRSLVDIDYQLRRLGRIVTDGERLVGAGHLSRREFTEASEELDYQRALRAVTVEAQTTDERLQEAQMTQLRSATTQLEANLVLARENLANLDVAAPVSGQVTAFDIEVGQSLARGERIGQIDDSSRFKLTALIDEFYLPRVDIGLRATTSVDGAEHRLRVSKIYPQVTNGQFEVDLAFDGDHPASVRRGQTLQLSLSLGDASTALLIPNGSFYQDTGGNWLFVVTATGDVAVRRSVRLGRRNAQYIEVLDGLEPGERIVASPYTGFVEMDRIRLNTP
ncbi:MAG: efflux RND transporter periplasmic adaptor subunit [Pseudomonadota bacterium]